MSEQSQSAKDKAKAESWRIYAGGGDAATSPIVSHKNSHHFGFDAGVRFGRSVGPDATQPQLWRDVTEEPRETNDQFIVSHLDGHGYWLRSVQQKEKNQ